MKTPMLVVVALCVALCRVEAQAPKPLRIAFAGPTSLTTWLSGRLKDEGQQVGLSFEVVPFSNQDRDYLIAVAQIGGAASAIVAVDRGGDVAASVSRSGRFSAKGVMDSCAQELVKKLAAPTK